MKISSFKLLASLACFTAGVEGLRADATYNVTVNSDSTSSPAAGSLRQAMLDAINNVTDQNIYITFADGLGTISLAGHLPVLSSQGSSAVNIVVNGGTGNTIDGSGSYQAFFVTPIVNNGSVATGTITATIENLTIQNCSITGGSGGTGGGGGGMGAGGAIFVDRGASVIAENIAFSSCSAIGGSGGTGDTYSSAGGGGARGGQGGTGNINSTTDPGGGGGGFGSNGGTGGASSADNSAGGGGGANILVTGSCNGGAGNSASKGGGGGAIGGNGASASSGGAGASGGGIGGSGGSTPGGSGGYGGGGAGNGSGAGGFGGGGGGGVSMSTGGAGGDFGGGGGTEGTGGAGGFGGGGGAGDTQGGTGGFGGGGGASTNSQGSAGFGGGIGGQNTASGGGGGAGFGGAIFFRSGGSLTLNGCSFSGNSVSGGNAGAGGGGAAAGQGLGADLFLQSGTTLSVTGDTTLPGTLYSDGSWTKSGSANLTLTGTNAYSGDTILSAGTLTLGSNSAIGTSALSMLDGSTLGVSDTISASNSIAITGTGTVSVSSGTGTLTGVISGGALNKAGAGILSLTNTNTYSSGTVISAGTLAIASAAKIGGSSAGLTLSGGTLHSTGDVPLSANINVTASSGIETDALFTTTLSGFLTGSNGATLTLSGAGTNTLSKVVVNSTDLFTIAGDIGGSSSLTKTGSGTLILTGTSSYTGKTYVNAGTLEVNGDITSSPDPIVAAGAILSGTGTVGDTVVQSGGTVKGGNPLGTLTIDGNLTFEGGSSFGSTIVPGDISLVNVTGNVEIGTTNYTIAFTPGDYNNHSAVILTGGHITGQFSTVDVNSLAANFLTANLTYTDTTVTLGVKARSFTGVVTGENAKQVGTGLQGAITYNRTKVSYTIGPNSTILASPQPQLVEVLKSLIPFTEAKQMTYALNQLHPAQLKGMAISQENNAVRVRESLSQRMLNDIDVENCMIANSYHQKNTSCCEKDKKMMTAWISGIGDTLKQDNVNNSYGPLTGYRTNTGGVVTGIDALFAEVFYAGALGGYTHSHLHFEDSKGVGDISSGYAGVYLSILGPQLWGGGFLGDVFYANASVIGSWSNYRADRHIEYGTVNLTAKNSHGGNQLLSHFDTGLNFNWFGLTVRPFDSFDYITQVERGYQEHNAGQWELTVSGKNAIMMRNELGLQFARCFCTCSSKWIVSPKFSWVREVRVKGETFNVNFTGGGTPFVIHGYFPDRNLFVPGLSLTGFMLDDAVTFDLYYNGEFTGGYSSNSFGGQIGYSF